MKKILILLGVLLCMVTLLVACNGETPTTTTPSSTTPPVTTPAVTTPSTNLNVIVNGVTEYAIVYPEGALQNDNFKNALITLRNAVRTYTSSKMNPTSDFIERGQEDTYVIPEYEILVGDTNREESASVGELGFDQGVIRVVGNKIVINGGNETMIAQAIAKFIADYMPEGQNTLVLPKDLNVEIKMDMTICSETGISYLEMAQNTYDAFNDAYWNGKRPQRNWFWDSAEMLEIYIDAYEATGDAEYKKKMTSFAGAFISDHGSDWTWNDYNDDIMWACIAFARLYDLTGTKAYLTNAKRNFDKTFAEAWTSDLGGGMFWRKDNQTKNSCVNCPAAIAACLLGKLTEDESYYDKAKDLIEWELKNMYENGRIYDSYNLSGEKSTWASTYNQGTFIGACTLLYQHTQDEAYLGYAEKAANYAMKNLTSDGIFNGEANLDNADLPGFKGILVRWLYRYAKEINDKEILVFLQNNAAVAYNNRNSEGLIWTAWKNQTPENATVDAGYAVFGMSTAVSLMFNCLPWS